LKTEISLKNIIKITLPIILGLVAQNIINVTNTIFLGHLSEVALGAAAIGGLYYFCFIILGAGFGIGVQIIIGRRNGENNIQDIKKVFSNSIYVAALLSLLLFMVLYLYSDFFLKSIISSENVLAETGAYIHFRKWGIFCAYISIILRSFFVGTLRTNVLIYSTLIMTVVNIFFDYSLIFGNFGFPHLGVGGAGIASVIAETCDVLFLMVWVFISRPVSKYQLFKFKKPDIQNIMQIMKLSYPMMLQYFFSFGAWFLFFVIIEKIGELELAVSNVVRSFYMVIMIPVWGLGSATNTMVSNLMGNKETDKIIPLIKKMIILSFTATVIIVLSYIFIPAKIMGFYSKDILLIQAAVPVLYVVSVTILLFSVAYIIFSAVSGTGNTMYAFFIEAFTIALYLSFAFLTGIVMKQKLYVVWSVETLYFIVLGLLSYLYFIKFKWKSIKI